MGQIPIYDDIKTINAGKISADIVSGGFPCQPFSVAGKQRGSKTMTAISGLKCLESLPKSNRGGLLEKMCQVLLTSTRAWYSDRCVMIWKNKVSKSNVLLYLLQASVRGIKEKEYGLWLTPSTMDISQRSPKAMQKRIQMRAKIGRKSIPPGNLAEQVQTGMPIKDMRDVEKHLRTKKQSFQDSNNLRLESIQRSKSLTAVVKNRH